MKLPLLMNRRTHTIVLHSSPSLLESHLAVFWIALHSACCIISLILGFRFSRIVYFLLLTTATNNFAIPGTQNSQQKTNAVTVGKHDILIREWPYPNYTEVLKMHWILEKVQEQQRQHYLGIKNPRPIIAVTTTYVRAFQKLHLAGLVNSLSLVPYSLTWVVVEAGGASNETAAILANSGLDYLHAPFPQSMPGQWPDRHLTEARMRLLALREIRKRELDGIIVFADESNVHNMEFFDEAQKVQWMGAVSVGILVDSVNSNTTKENASLPIQGPACNSSGSLVGWHTFDPLPYMHKNVSIVGEEETVVPMKFEWAGFVMNSRLLWKNYEGWPSWFRGIDKEVASPLDLVSDRGLFVEPLGNCGKNVLVWWLRAEASQGTKFPSLPTPP